MFDLLTTDQARRGHGPPEESSCTIGHSKCDIHLFQLDHITAGPAIRYQREIFSERGDTYIIATDTAETLSRSDTAKI